MSRQTLSKYLVLIYNTSSWGFSCATRKLIFYFIYLFARIGKICHPYSNNGFIFKNSYTEGLV
jgi:hypothetical protein